MRVKLGFAPWFALLVIALGLLSDHGVIDLHGLMDAGSPVPHHRTHQRAHAAAPPAPAEASTGTRLSTARIYAYARGAGFTPDQARVATAIALAESGGRPRAHNPVPPDDSYCLMQVNMLGALGPERRARFNLRSNSDLYDPAVCMRAAYSISGGGSSWQPWTTYTRGSYRQYLALSDQARR
jgi:hypothetical protein